jgi:hypothetical protein
MCWKFLEHIYHRSEYRFCHKAHYCDGLFDPEILQLLPGLGTVFGEEFIPSLQPTLLFHYTIISRSYVLIIILRYGNLSTYKIVSFGRVTAG